MRSPVESYNEWDPLEEVIVGSARNAARCAADPVKSSYLGFDDPRRALAGAPRDLRELRRAEDQLDNLADLLLAEGVVVRRPESHLSAAPYATPDFSVDHAYGTACPRDFLLVVGDELIEAPMAMRARYFEFQAYRTLVSEYFGRGARWTAAPKPSLRDELYRTPFTVVGDPFDADGHALLAETEPVFEAACFARFGRDLFWQPDLVSNTFGATWLQRHLGADFRLHRVEFGDGQPLHIDATLVPVRPGIVLVHPDRPFLRGKELFVDNGWEILTPPRSGNLKHNWVGMNLLMVDPHTAIVEAGEAGMIDFMRDLCCRVIPCPLDAIFPLGGSIHCATSDVRRRGELRSYFPSLD